MSWQTFEMSKKIALAKTGDKAALKILREVLSRIVAGEDTPNSVIIALAEIALEYGIDQGRKDAEIN